MIQVKLFDGKVIDVEQGSTYADVAFKISPSFRKKVLAVKVQNHLYDLSSKAVSDAVEFITLESKEAFEILNHSCAHLLAQAIKRIYPNALFWVGPAIEEGFYYDIDLGDDVIKEEDLAKIELVMKKIAKDGEKIIRKELSKEEALQFFQKDCYKIDLIENLPENSTISIYQQGEFIDLCRGPHLENASGLKHFKVLRSSGAYFKGDSKNKMLQRVYGIAFASSEQLENYLYILEEAKKRDHKKLGKELELFMMSEYGPGFPFFLPNGLILRKQLENFWYSEHTKEGYEFIQTPIMLNQELWQISGHWANYGDNMYTSTMDERNFAIKPMNCPGAMLVYKNALHSYKELPIRIGELGLVHRHEASGALNGLFRVRNFTQDDAHIYMREDQIESEVIRLISFIDRIYSVFNLTYSIELSTRPEEKYIGSLEVWDHAEAALKAACEHAGKELKLNPGDGAFYGPKLDFKIKDSLGRVWQCGTIQLDMNMPTRFDLTYIDSEGNKKRPIMLHRVIFGSMERIIGILIEHYAGAFPLWLAPVQCQILPVMNAAHSTYAEELKSIFFSSDLRSKVDNREEKLGYRMRESQMKKIPYILVIGDQEVENRTVTYRKHGETNQVTLSIDKFVEMLKLEVVEKR